MHRCHAPTGRVRLLTAGLSGAAVLTAAALVLAPAAHAIGGPAQTKTLSAHLTGAAEVLADGTPNQGDPDGIGLASVVAEQSTGSAGSPPAGDAVCVRIIVTGIDTPTMAHIHKAASTTTGPVVVPLPTPTGGVTSACVSADAALVEDIALNPAAYYVNVHTSAYPNGAVRGQLASGPSPLTANLTGALEQTGGAAYKGDVDGHGAATVLVDPDGTVCMTIAVDGIDAPMMMHIHRGVYTENGPVLVPFTVMPTGGSAVECVTTSTDNAREVIAEPGGHYVNVHTAPFPGGAIRGQLTAGATAQHAVGANGAVYLFGDAAATGSAATTTLNKPIVGMATSPSGNGSWLVASDGGVFAYGDATFHGSAGGITLNKPIVGMAATPSGRGYWLVASDGGVFAYGDATFHGSTGGMPLNKPIVGMEATVTGRGYWLVASDGGIFAFGDATFHGSTGAIALAQPIVGMARTPMGDGYWLAAADGGVFAFDAPFLGSSAGASGGSLAATVAISAAPAGWGYRLITSVGALSSFGDVPELGSIPGPSLPLPAPGVALTR